MKRHDFLKITGCGVLAAAMPSFATSRSTKTGTTLWQLPEQTKSQMNSYVIQTSGNELIVIDGGTAGDADYLRQFIRDRGNHVHAWFISHPHLDHADALTAILNDLGELKIDKVYEALLEDDWLMEHQNAGAYNTQQKLVSALDKANVELLDLTPGQLFKFKGVEFEILLGVSPEITHNAINNQSSVMRMNVNDQSVLFLGDLGHEGGQKLLAGPYRNRLKADYVQMSHHGQAGVSQDFYKAVNPKYALWPCPNWLWENDISLLHKDKEGGPDTGPWHTPKVREWMDNMGVKEHYVSKDGLHRIDF